MRTDMSWGNRFEGGWVWRTSACSSITSIRDRDPRLRARMPSHSIRRRPSSRKRPASVRHGQRRGQRDRRDDHHVDKPPAGPRDHAEPDAKQPDRTASGGFAWIVRRNLSQAGSGKMNTMRFSFGPKFLQVNDYYSSVNYSSNRRRSHRLAPPRRVCRQASRRSAAVGQSPLSTRTRRRV